VAPIIVFAVWNSGAGLGLTTLFGTAGLWCLGFGRQARLRDAEAILSNDPRPPVLYLRAFRADLLRTRLRDWRYAFVPWQRGYFEQLGGGLSLDTMLKPAIQSTVGPFIAMGKPDDTLAPFGAARLYRNEQEWQDAVRGLLKRAAAILILGVESLGVVWELETIRVESDPRKLFILTFPTHTGHGANWAAFVRAAREIGYVLPPDDPGPGAVLAFDESWTATLLLTQARAADAYANAIAARLASSA